jgi:hypothetical protein
MTMQKRATVGGEIGMNGEFYAGGEFLPNTQLASQHKDRVKAVAERKQEFEPYKWSIAPSAGMKSIYAQLAGSYGKFNRSTGTFEVFAPYVSNLSTELQARATDLVNRYNAGERWI